VVQSTIFWSNSGVWVEGCGGGGGGRLFSFSSSPSVARVSLAMCWGFSELFGFLHVPLPLLEWSLLARIPPLPRWSVKPWVFSVLQRCVLVFLPFSFFPLRSGGALWGMLPSCVGDLIRGQFLARCPNFLHFLH
jgi:hypothetical protein